MSDLGGKDDGFSVLLKEREKKKGELLNKH